MNITTKSSAQNLEDIDLLLAQSVNANAAKPSQIDALQTRIVADTANMPQLSMSQVSMPQRSDSAYPSADNLREKAKAWFSFPQMVGAAALAFTLVLAVTMWLPNAVQEGGSQGQIVDNGFAVEANLASDFSVLSEQEAKMDEYQDLVWEELLLSEDELVFARL